MASFCIAVVSHENYELQYRSLLIVTHLPLCVQCTLYDLSLPPGVSQQDKGSSLELPVAKSHCSLPSPFVCTTNCSALALEPVPFVQPNSKQVSQAVGSLLYILTHDARDAGRRDYTGMMQCSYYQPTAQILGRFVIYLQFHVDLGSTARTCPSVCICLRYTNASQQLAFLIGTFPKFSNGRASSLFCLLDNRT